MADYSRAPRRFFYTGMSLVPQDALAPGKDAYIRNMRTYQPGTLTVRNGYHPDAAALPDAVMSGARLNDTTPYAQVGAPSRRLLGVNTGLYGGSPGGPYGLVVGGFSGDVLSYVSAAPVNSPRPFMYIGDSVQMRKVNSDLEDMPIGIPTPEFPPSAQFELAQVVLANAIDDTSWVDYGVAAAPTVVDRVNPLTVVDIILFDSGTTGMASVAPSDFTGMAQGGTVVVGIEKVIIQEIHPSVGATTIAAIQYDGGTSGLCTIQPTGSLYTGQMEAATPDDVRRRYADLHIPVPPKVTVTRTVDFPVDSIVLLGGFEAVRILSVAYGTDGRISFRCQTTGTFSVGDAIEGRPSFRASFATTPVVGDAITGAGLETTITLSAADTAETGGVQAPAAGGLLDWGMIGPQATSSPDIIRFGFKASQFGYIQSVRLMLNLSDDDGYGGSNFLRNYFLYEWRASDLLSAVQIAAGQAVGLMADAQAGAVQQGQTDAAYSDQYGQQPTPGIVVGARPDGPVGFIGGTARAVPGSGALGSAAGGLLGGTPGAPGSFERIAQHAVDSYVQVGSTASRQISLGDDQWVWLQCRVGDLTRIGTDTTKTLATINGLALVAQVLGTTDPVTITFSDLYLTGGYGPDCGQTLAPYVYRYRYRSTITGERSNPSPSMRAGLAPQRGALTLSGFQSGAPQCDAVDWFRFGGTLPRWTYVGTSDNSGTPTFRDVMEDGQIDGGEGLTQEQYQPWPTYDLPRAGTCAVAGTSITWVSGDTFNTGWGANSAIIVNGRATTLYQSPTSSTRAHVVDNCGDGIHTFTVPGADFLGQPLPALFGGPLNGVWFNFACGDTSDPSLLHWTNGNDPDATSPRNTIVVSSGSSPLMHGFFDDGIPYVFSTDKLYRIEPQFGQGTAFLARETQCTAGLWARWAFAVFPDGGGVVFLAKDGIYLSKGGSDAVSLTNPDLRALFPQDGVSSFGLRGFKPVDMTQENRLRLAVVDNLIYFDYVDTSGAGQTLICELSSGQPSWSYDRYDEAPTGVIFRMSEDGPNVHDMVMGLPNGVVAISDITDGTDNGTAIDWEIDTDWANGEDVRTVKQWGDAILDMNAGNSFAGIEVTPVATNGQLALPMNLLGQGEGIRKTYIVEVNSGEGVISRNFGLVIHGLCQVCDTNRPIFYLWEPAFLQKQTPIAFRATDWEDLGYTGAKFIQGIVLRANTFGATKTLLVQGDGVTQLSFTINHNGERTVAYPLSSDGWDPFIAELVRLKGDDSDEWTLLDWRWVFEPAPESATQWETQDTTFDLPGFLSVHDAELAYSATAPVNLTVWHGDNPLTYVLPVTLGAYRRVYTRFAAAKGPSARFRLQSDEPFRLYKRDCSVRVQGWGLPGGFQSMQPFGGPHRVDGAAI